MIMKYCKVAVKNTVYLFFLFLLFLTGQTAAQSQPDTILDDKPFTVSAGFGYSFIGYREETDIPINRYLNTLYIALEGSIHRNDFIYYSNTGFFYGENDAIEIDSSEEFFTHYQRNSKFYKLYLEKALDRRLWGSSVFPGFLGGALRLDANFTHLPETIYYGISGTVCLNVHVTQKWLIDEKNKFIFTASIPVFGYAIRPPYYGLIYAPSDMDSRITSLHNHQAFFGELKYIRTVTDLFSYYLNLGTELSHISFPQPRKDALVRLSAGAVFSF